MVALNTISTSYESIIVFDFLILMTLALGGFKNALLFFNTLPGKCQKFNVYLCWFFALQFVVLSPIIGILTTVLEFLHLYDEGLWSAQNAFPYLKVISVVSAIFGFASLIIFYKSTKKVLASWNPIFKFICIKVFLFLLIM